MGRAMNSGVLKTLPQELVKPLGIGQCLAMLIGTVGAIFLSEDVRMMWVLNPLIVMTWIKFLC